MKLIRELVVRFATENSSWGYCRIEGALKNPRPSGCSEHDCEDPEGAGHQACTRAPDLVAYVPQIALGAVRCNGLLHDRSVDAERPSDLLRAVLHQAEGRGEYTWRA